MTHSSEVGSNIPQRTGRVLFPSVLDALASGSRLNRSSPLA